ncbi:hypothetical protein LC612_35685 [Nostoc sp. CHAB 5834]|nr:hypothetical protein [Nostoc sp. CHAB 5834]
MYCHKTAIALEAGFSSKNFRRAIATEVQLFLACILSVTAFVYQICDRLRRGVALSPGRGSKSGIAGLLFL